jgi:hypothetical protein
MPDSQDRDDVREEPQLELPSLSLGFRRRKKKDREPEEPAESPSVPEASVETAAAAPADPIPVRKAPPPPPRKGTGAPPPPPPRRTPPPMPTAAPPPAAPPPAAPELDEDPWDTELDAAPPQPLAPELHPAATVTAPVTPAKERRTRTQRPARTAPRRKLDFRQRLEQAQEVTLPPLPGPVAALLTGVATGLVTVLLAWLAARGCDAVRGVGTCGKFGLFALIAILGIEVLLGAFLLRAWKVEEPTSTSFFGIGLVAVVTMLFFLDDIDSPWMVLVIPLLTAVSFLVSWWVTATFVDEGRD